MVVFSCYNPSRMALTRINKYLSQNGYCSRREADRLIEQGRVFVNDKRARLGDQIGDQDVVRVEGRDQKRAPENVYILLNKPAGITTDARKEYNVTQFVQCQERVFPVGKLDAWCIGLVILTNDETLASRLSNPKYGIEEEYVVDLDRELTKLDLGKLQSATMSGNDRTRQTKIRQLYPNRFAIVIRNRSSGQIRHLCEDLRYRVVDIMRTRIGLLKIPMSFPVGASRNLSPSEVRALKKSVRVD